MGGGRNLQICVGNEAFTAAASGEEVPTFTQHKWILAEKQMALLVEVANSCLFST